MHRCSKAACRPSRRGEVHVSRASELQAESAESSIQTARAEPAALLHSQELCEVSTCDSCACNLPALRRVLPPGATGCLDLWIDPVKAAHRCSCPSCSCPSAAPHLNGVTGGLHHQTADSACGAAVKTRVGRVLRRGACTCRALVCLRVMHGSSADCSLAWALHSTHGAGHFSTSSCDLW